jgi:HD superfamily phosphodiesterase
MIQNHPQIEQVSSYVSNLFTTDARNHLYLIYHNLSHTVNVVAKTEQIASFYKLDNIEHYILLTAAWFHDCGHLNGPPLGHEARSVLMLEEFMGDSSVNDPVISQIANCILSTKIPNDPANLLEEILCDSDLFHLGTSEFSVADLQVKQEYELRTNMVMPDWDQNSLAFLLNHRYYTRYCRDLLDRGKAENINRQIQKIGKIRIR